MARPRVIPERLDDVPLAHGEPQLDLFPEKPEVMRLNPRAVAGQHTAVLEIVRVRFRAQEAPHLVFHDRHGWYCETHGTHCAAVGLAREAVNRHE